MSDLIIITGAPGAGKTTVAEALKEELGWPLVAKDDIKDHFFEEIEYQGRDFNAKLGNVARSLIVYFSNFLADLDTNFIIEGNFAKDDFSTVFNGLSEEYGLRLYQVFCTGEPETIKKRYDDRHSGGNRSSGHDPVITIEDVQWFNQPLDIRGDLYTVKDLNFDAKIYVKDKGLKPKH